MLTLPKTYVNFYAYMPFLTFEGIDGSGKSSLMKSFAQYLKEQGHLIETTREPGGSEIGQELREILLRTKGFTPCPQTELLIYEADRAQHVATRIKPWLAQGKWVLSDRFADSSLAFQGAGRKINTEDVKWLNDFATQGLKPDLTVLVDCPVETGLARRKKRETKENQGPDRFEQESRNFHQAVRDAYLDLAKAEPQRFVILDAHQSPEILLKTLIAEIKKRGWL